MTNLQTDQQLLSELIELAERAEAICRTMAYRREQTGWIKVGALFSTMRDRIRAIRDRRVFS